MKDPPRSILVAAEKFFLISHLGIVWYDPQKQSLVGFQDNCQYSVIHNEEGEVLVFKVGKGVLSWWPIFKIYKESLKQQIVRVDEDGKTKYIRYNARSHSLMN